MSNDLVEIARFHSTAEAAIARNRLDAADIPACLDGEVMANWFWYLGSAIGGVKLLVNDSDADRAATILSSVDTISEEDAIDFGDDSTQEGEDQEHEVSPELTRAFRASILGVFLLPPLLNIYSTYLIFRHHLVQSPWNWRLRIAVSVNLSVFLFFCFIIGTIIAPRGFNPHRPPPNIDESELVPISADHPIEWEHKEAHIPVVP